MLHIIKKSRISLPPWPAVGRCIYCLTGPESRLTREHVIPAGIGGDIVLPAATCDRCQRHIHRYETQVVLGHFGHMRSALCINSNRKPKKGYERPATYATYITDGPIEVGQSVRNMPKIEHDVSQDMPTSFIYESSGDIPTVISGVDPSGLKKMVPSVFFDNVTDKGAFLGSGKIMLGEFSRFVAKVAHGFAVASLGIDGFKPYLTDYILGSGPENLPQFIGISQLNPVCDGSALHRIELVQENRLAHLYPLLPPVSRNIVVVTIDFFCTDVMPGLTAVVGETLP